MRSEKKGERRREYLKRDVFTKNLKFGKLKINFWKRNIKHEHIV